MLFKEFCVRRIFIVLLTQQYAVPSAGLGEKVEEQGLALGLGLARASSSEPGCQFWAESMAASENNERKTMVFFIRTPLV